MFKGYSKSFLDSTVFGNSIIDRITNKGQKSMKLLFNGQRDGMYSGALWKHCLNKGPTITICESRSGQVFGGYSPCKWIRNGGWQQDASLTSFLFSATREQIYPLKEKEYAIIRYGNQGPTFGGGNDLTILADFIQGGSNLGHSYDTSQYQVADQYTHLFGGTIPDLTSIEVYLIE